MRKHYHGKSILSIKFPLCLYFLSRILLKIDAMNGKITFIILRGIQFWSGLTHLVITKSKIKDIHVKLELDKSLHIHSIHTAIMSFSSLNHKIILCKKYFSFFYKDFNLQVLCFLKNSMKFSSIYIWFKTKS